MSNNETEHNAQEAAPPVGSSVASKKPVKNIVICSDGTWQKGGQATPTNVWRTYLAVDTDDQLKFHDDGVGSDGVRLYQIIGGAFGFGISRNITELVECLIKAYEPGARIYLFGFSRGAFTVRVLADLICRLGIPKKAGKSSEEIKQLARALLNYYKSLNTGHVPKDKKAAQAGRQDDAQKPDSPSEKAEAQREFIKDVQEKLETYGDESKEDGKFLVHFVGCWDTVEAVGLPTDFLKKFAINNLFPLRFSDQHPDPKIKYLYHAICLDDERKSFHPLLWQTPPGGLAKDQTMEQVWFMGGHSHVGGGYGKDQLAMEPLFWMLGKAQKAGLRLNQELLKQYEAQAYRQGKMHPSRPWLAKFYRFQPRLMSQSFLNRHNKPCTQDIADCRVHESVLERIRLGIDSYAPTAIDVDFQTVSNGTDESSAKCELPKAYRESLKVANEKYIRWGANIYYACVAWCILIAVWCYWKNSHIGGPQITKAQPLIEFSQPALRFVSHCIYSAEHCFLQVVSSFLPSFIGNTAFAWLKNLPGTLTLFCTVYAILLLIAGYLRKRTHHSAMQGWHESGILGPQKDESEHDDVEVPWAFNVGRATLITSILIATLFAIWLGWKPYHSYARSDKAFVADTRLDRECPSREIAFDTIDPLFPTGIYIQEGAEYEIVVSNLKEWKDDTIPVESAKGIGDHLPHKLCRWFRIGPRNPDEPIFEMNAAIGQDGKPFSVGEKVQFRATTSGQLFLFVNDVAGFYANNQGTADVVITQKFLSKPKDTLLAPAPPGQVPNS